MEGKIPKEMSAANTKKRKSTKQEASGRKTIRKRRFIGEVKGRK